LIRSIAVLIAAMQMSRPGMPAPEAKGYAKVLNEVAQARHFDPLIAVAIIHFETQWRPTLISTDGEDYGLGQVRARYLGVCRNDADPLNAPSEACQRGKTALLDGATNLRRMGSIIEANMEFCKARTGSSKMERWLSGYQGYGDPDRGIYCAPGEKTFQVIGYYNELIAKLAPPPKKNPPKAKKPNTPPPAHGAEPKRAQASAKATTTTKKVETKKTLRASKSAPGAKRAPRKGR